MKSPFGLSALSAMLCVHSIAAQDFKIGSTKETSSSAKRLATRLMNQYEKADGETFIPGLLPDGMYFGQSGAFMGSMIDYWYLTGDDTYNDAIQRGMLYQIGIDEDFFPANQTRNMANDDQCLWALAAMTAAESGFAESDGEPSWLDLAKAVYSSQTKRIDNRNCDGGLRWQVFNFNIGWDYKHTFSNGCLMNLGARLARYTGEKKYSKTVDELWDWLVDTKLIDERTYTVYNGAEVADENCDEVDKFTFSNSASILSYTAAVMYNYTDGSNDWRERTEALTGAILEEFFKDGAAFEPDCEDGGSCGDDISLYKGLMHRWLAASTQVAPFLASDVLPVLKTSAKAAVDQCTGGRIGTRCGFFWSDGEYKVDSFLGINEDINVLSAVTNLLISEVEGPATDSSGGNDSDDSDENGAESSSSTGSESPSETGSEDSAAATESGDSAAGVVAVSKYTAMLVGCGLVISSIAGPL